MPTTPIAPKQEKSAVDLPPKPQSANETKPQKRSLNSVLKGLQPGKSSGNEELAKPNLIEPLAKAESNFRDNPEPNLAQRKYCVGYKLTNLRLKKLYDKTKKTTP